MKPLHETKTKRLWVMTDETILEGEVPEEVREPWGLLVVDQDGEWTSDFQDRIIENAIKLGCRYFLITGGNAEDWEESINEIATSMAPEENVVIHTVEDGEVDEAVEHFLSHAKEDEAMQDLAIVFLDVGDYDEDDYTDQLTSMME